MLLLRYKILRSQSPFSSDQSCGPTSPYRLAHVATRRPRAARFALSWRHETYGANGSLGVGADLGPPVAGMAIMPFSAGLLGEGPVRRSSGIASRRMPNFSAGLLGEGPVAALAHGLAAHPHWGPHARRHRHRAAGQERGLVRGRPAETVNLAEKLIDAFGDDRLPGLVSFLDEIAKLLYPSLDLFQLANCAASAERRIGTRVALVRLALISCRAVASSVCLYASRAALACPSASAHSAASGLTYPGGRVPPA